MKTLNDYMSMSYRMEVVEDKTEGGFVRISLVALPAEKQWKVQFQMPWMQKKHGLKLH